MKATWAKLPGLLTMYDDVSDLRQCCYCAKVYGYAKIGDDHAKVFGNTRVIGEAIVSDEAVISDSATIMESAIVGKGVVPFVVRLLLVEMPTLAIVPLFTVRLCHGNARVNKNARSCYNL